MLTRREFLAAAAAVPASDRIALGLIGVGWQGENNVKSFLELADVRVAAVCDVDTEHLDSALSLVNARYGNRDCAAYRAFEELLARGDIDAVALSVPDHWHGIVSIQAARAGKDIYGEKPLAQIFGEGRAICEAVARYGRVWQTGSWQRSEAQFRHACELVRNGRIGRVTRVEVGLPGGHTDFDGRGHETKPGPPPGTLDWDRWLGPAPVAPYSPARVHKTWRWNSDYGGGMLMDWIGHHVDTAHWGLGYDETGPIEVDGRGEFETQHPIWNTVKKFRVTARYESGVEMIISDDLRRGAKWIGEEGWIWVDRAGLEAQPKSALTSRIGPNEIRLPRSPGHHRQFIDCVKSRGPTLAPCDVALRSTVPGYLGTISMLVGRKVKWDPRRQAIVADASAARLLDRPMRSPWRLD
jgi:predicted dehydrogenase